MPGRNNGTGQPITLRCAKCKIGTTHFSVRRGMNLEATGKVRELSSYEKGHRGVRQLTFSAQYRCLDCGHVGWSRHYDMERYLRRFREGGKSEMDSRNVATNLARRPESGLELAEAEVARLKAETEKLWECIVRLSWRTEKPWEYRDIIEARNRDALCVALGIGTDNAKPTSKMACEDCENENTPECNACPGPYMGGRYKVRKSTAGKMMDDEGGQGEGRR